MTTEETWLLEEKYRGEKTAGFFADCARLAAGEPLAYIIGHVPFLGCQIWLDSHPLIPRPETEFWVEGAIAAMGVNRSQGDTLRTVLDLCAGSGCIGVAVARHLPDSQVTFAEIDPAHLPTIEKNCRENCTTDRAITIVSDLFQIVTGQFDFILSNPPYIDPTLDRTQDSVKDFEPHRALYGGVHGSELIEQIIKEAPAHLNPGGQLWLEHEPEHTALIAALGAASGFTVSTLPDQYGVLRYSPLVLQ